MGREQDFFERATGIEPAFSAWEVVSATFDDLRR